MKKHLEAVLKRYEKTDSCAKRRTKRPRARIRRFDHQKRDTLSGIPQGVEKGFSTPCKCKSAKAVLHLGHHFLVKWVSKIPHFTARAPSFSEAEGAATLRLPPETRDPPQRGRGAIKKMIEEAVVPTEPRSSQ